jgi:ubiquitin carboxyl-terminal hydrolase 4/11/15
MTIDTQLPTPPSETNSSYMGGGVSRLAALSQTKSHSLQPHANDHWNPRSNGLNAGSFGPSPPPDDPPDFEDSQSNGLATSSLDPLLLASRRFDSPHFEFPDPSNKASPTSSNEAEADLDTDPDDDDWHRPGSFAVMARDSSPGGSPDWSGLSGMVSPSGSSISDMNPFTETTIQKIDNDDDLDLKDLPHEKIA